MLVNMSIIIALFIHWLSKKRHFTKDFSGIWIVIAPVLRLIVLLLYFFTVFHKLNWDYFNWEYSCGSALYSEMVNYLNFLPQGEIINSVVLYAVLAIEVMIPILLIVPKTAKYGLLMGMIFHFILALHPNIMILSFTYEMYALYIVFMPKEQAMSIMISIRHFVKGIEVNYKLTKLLAIIFGLIIVQVIIYILFLRTSLTQVATYWYILIFDLKLILVVLILLTLTNFKISPDNYYVSFRPKPLILAFVPFIILLNGIAPYFNVKTATTFSMFSNLRISGTATNHIIIQQTYPLLDHLSFLAEIVKTDYEPLAKIQKRNEKITLFELQRVISNYKSEEEKKITYSIEDKEYIIVLPLDKKLAYYEELPLWQRKLLIYRTIPQGEICPCQW